MSLLGILSSGGFAFPGFTRLRNKNLKVYDPKQPSVLLWNITDSEFHSGWYPNGDTYSVGIAVSNLSASYDESGSTMTIVSTEDWSSPAIPNGAYIEFWAEIPETWPATKQPSWVQNNKGTGIFLLFSGRVENVSQSGEAESGFGISYVCKSAAYFSRFVTVRTLVNTFPLPERHYNIDPTDNPALYKRSIKKATTLQGNSQYAFGPFGYSGIAGPNAFGVAGNPTNSTANLKMTVGEIIRDLFASHGELLVFERVVPANWDWTNNAGLSPFVDVELDALDEIPEPISLIETSFFDAVQAIIRRAYPNVGIWVDRQKVWHFTPVIDNLIEVASDPSDVYDPTKWLEDRLGLIEMRMAEPQAGDDAIKRKKGELVRGRLVKGDIGTSISDRYTAVRIVGHEVVETTEESLQSGGLLPNWGQGDPARQAALQSGYIASGPRASIHRHYDPGDNNWGIPVYSAVAGEAGQVVLSFRGHGSVLWPHTNYEWVGTTCLVAFGGLSQVRNNYKWFTQSGQFTIVASTNVADIGDGTPGYSVTIVASVPASEFKSEVLNGASKAARIQLSDDASFATTTNINQLAATFREFTISESSTTYGDSLINENPNTPCNVRLLVNEGALREGAPDGTIGGRPKNLLEFGQSLGRTTATYAGRLHSRASGGAFWFGGSLIVPFAAIREGRARAEEEFNAAAFSEVCRQGRAILADDIKVIFEKSTQTFLEVRAPGENFAGTAFIYSGVRRELLLKAERFVDPSQATEFKKLAESILKVVSDIEPSGDGWEFNESTRFLSLMDLHFRADIEWFQKKASIAGYPFSIKQAIVTKIDYDFERDTATLSLDSRHNPFGSYTANNLLEIISNSKLFAKVEEQRAKKEREEQCRKSFQEAYPIPKLSLVENVCDSQVTRDSGAGRGKPRPPDCHVVGGGLVEMPIGVPGGSSGGGGSLGYPAGKFSEDINLSAGRGWTVIPFYDSLGRLFFWDRYGSFFRGDESAIVNGESLPAGILTDNSDPNWAQTPIVHGDGEATQVLASIMLELIGFNTKTPAPPVYNHVKSYDEETGIITLMYDNLQAGLYTNGMLAASNGPGAMPSLFIESHTAGTITLKEPAGGFPTEDVIEAGTHLYIIAQRKPIHDSSLPEGTRLLKNKDDEWVAITSAGVYHSVSVAGATNFTPVATSTGVIDPDNFIDEAIDAIIGGGVPNGDKGDVIVSGSGDVWTVDDGVITLTKMANIAGDTVIGNASASPGEPEEIPFTPVARTFAAKTTKLGQREAVELQNYVDLIQFGTPVTKTTFQAALDYLTGLGGGILDVPAGTYTFDGEIWARDNVTIRCAPGVTFIRDFWNSQSRGLFGNEHLYTTPTKVNNFRIEGWPTIGSTELGGKLVFLIGDDNKLFVKIGTWRSGGPTSQDGWGISVSGERFHVEAYGGDPHTFLGADGVHIFGGSGYVKLVGVKAYDDCLGIFPIFTTVNTMVSNVDIHDVHAELVACESRGARIAAVAIADNELYDDTTATIKDVFVEIVGGAAHTDEEETVHAGVGIWCRTTRPNDQVKNVEIIARNFDCGKRRAAWMYNVTDCKISVINAENFGDDVVYLGQGTTTSNRCSVVLSGDLSGATSGSDIIKMAGHHIDLNLDIDVTAPPGTGPIIYLGSNASTQTVTRGQADIRIRDLQTGQTALEIGVGCAQFTINHFEAWIASGATGTVGIQVDAGTGRISQGGPFLTDAATPVINLRGISTRFDRRNIHTTRNIVKTETSTVDFVVYPSTGSNVQFLSGTITGNKSISLSTNQAYDGDYYIFVRTGVDSGGIWHWDVGGLVNLLVGESCRVDWDANATAWKLTSHQKNLTNITNSVASRRTLLTYYPGTTYYSTVQWNELTAAAGDIRYGLLLNFRRPAWFRNISSTVSAELEFWYRLNSAPAGSEIVKMTLRIRHRNSEGTTTLVDVPYDIAVDEATPVNRAIKTTVEIPVSTVNLETIGEMWTVQIIKPHTGMTYVGTVGFGYAEILGKGV